MVCPRSIRGKGGEGMNIRYMLAKYNSTCPICQRPIKKGYEIVYDARTRKAYHDDCHGGDDGECIPDVSDLAYEDQCASMCGYGL